MENRMTKLHKGIRRLWCKIHEEENECSQFTPGAIWGMDYYYIVVKYLIPYWIKEDDVDDYIDKYQGEYWLYL